MDRLARFQLWCLGLATAIAFAVLMGWSVPVVGAHLPSGWTRMSMSATVLLVLSAVSCSMLCGRHVSARARRVAYLIAAIVMVLAALRVLEIFSGTSLPIDMTATGSGKMSIRTCWFFLLLAPLLLTVRIKRRPASYLVDLLAFSLCTLVLMLVLTAAFSAMQQLGVATAVHGSPHTLLCMVLISVAVFSMRMEYGVFSVLMGNGIGSRMVRTVGPPALVLPFLLEMLRGTTIHSKVLTYQYATAITTVSATCVIVLLAIFTGWRINTLEEGIRELSLRDELTRLYNRRGFALMSEQAARIARRAKVPVSVLFIDVDNLKMVNDRLGHDAGSKMLSEFAAMLETSFRQSDVIGRVGGDEFVIVGSADVDGIALVARNLEATVERRNLASPNEYRIEFSYGCATLGPEETLSETVARADKEMYQAKQRKKAARTGTAPALVQAPSGF